MAECLRIQPVWVGSNLNATCPLKKGGYITSGSTTETNEEPYFVEAASQTFKVGDLVFLDSDGRIALCTLTGVQLTSAIAGQALVDGQNGSAGVPKTYLHAIRSDDLFVMNVMHATAASAITAQNQLGTVRGLRRDAVTQLGSSLTRWCVDIENAVEGGADANARVKIVGFMQRGLVLEADGSIGANKAVAIGDKYGLVIVHFLPWSAASDFAPFTRILQLSN